MTAGEAMAVAALALALATVAAVRRVLAAGLEPVVAQAAVSGLIVGSVSESREIGVSAAMAQWRTDLEPSVITPEEHDRLDRAVATVMESDDLHEIAQTLATVARSETVQAAARAYTAASVEAAEDAIAEQHEAAWWDRLLASWPTPGDPEPSPEREDEQPAPQDDELELPDYPDDFDPDEFDREIEAEIDARPDDPDDEPAEVSYRLVWATDSDPCSRCVAMRGKEYETQDDFRPRHIGCGCYLDLEIQREDTR